MRKSSYFDTHKRIIYIISQKISKKLTKTLDKRKSKCYNERALRREPKRKELKNET